MKSAYQIIRRPVITEKGLAIKENQNTLVFQVAQQGDQDRDQGSSADDFQSEGAARCAPRIIPAKSGGGASLPATVRIGRRRYVRLRAGEKMPEYAQNL